jgi:predicted RNA methylase
MCCDVTDKINILIDEAVEKKVTAIVLKNKNELKDISIEENNIPYKMNSDQNTGLNRETTDKFYTKDITVNWCLEFIKKYIHIDKNDLIIEPSAGNGSFIPGIQALTNNCIFYDIEPGHTEVVKHDYLKHNYADVNNNYNNIHVIGNPPFGRQSSLAIGFIKKSCMFCNTISFILPKSFKKESKKKTFPSQFHLVFEIDLPEKSFLVNDEEYNVETVFQIWEKRNYARLAIENVNPCNFIFVKKTEFPDIAIRRVGGTAGKKIFTIFDDAKTNCFYFIKFTNNKSICDNVSLLQYIQFNHNNTVGPRSISKQELIIEFNKYLV